MTGPTTPAPLLGERVHLIGIGGAGMGGIARILLARGVAVSGSDAKDSRTVMALRALGAHVAVGHDAGHLDQLDGPPTVVVSTAIRETNPELAAARERGLLVVHRADALADLTTGRRVAAVAGTHGKTSTSSMLTVALQHCGFDPSFAIGGDLAASGAGAHHGAGDVFVVEADESDGSFTAYTPGVAVVTNVEPDHLDHHGTEAAYRAVFHAFVGRIPAGGVLVACVDDPGAAELADHAEQRGLTVRRYGRTAAGTDDAVLVDHRPDGAGARVRARHRGVELAVRLAVPGEHMALNALGAFLAGVELGAPVDALLEGLAGFDGVRRRFEYKGRAAGVAVYDDYAHHPTEVAATLRAARAVAGTGRVVVGFQPHLYSRTRLFAAEFGAALSLADEVVVLDVYGAREDPEPGVTGALVADAVDLPVGAVRHVPSWSEVPVVLAGIARPGDLVLTMGAGDVTVLGPEVLRELEVREEGSR
ncbi:UDP-N-acetylmuramate--L-alanine ligase [Pseudonocardia sulfidoxydans NBRC 16205]|uniref:UDP-N-acetylmuramate--L-alanine ligase n=1 Tax=Pseudonocardia sulfidoxydans NBRC 16205 TaxID=1223511 RepID=A0A511DET1_9PSEU|nr:UDP-N-acetylmuramate--L-alanine ligase [Pseudonocardia sulfidoxydans]GEL23300.1 UDP-N-acetylmuramate--L-alanine ligase [Pseudonocardia sulfidoxydans NBRC 16205]